MEITNIIHKILQNKALSQHERDMYDIWILEPDNKQQLADYKKLWGVVEPEIKLQPNVEMQWKRFKDNNSKQIKPFQKRFFKSLSAIAAVLIIAVGIFSIIMSETNKPEIYAANNQTKTIVLNDGSEVVLNANSMLEVSNDFNKKARLVSLRGEALFDIKRNTNVPFVVNLNNDLSIKVLGTKFNVRNYENSNISELKVLSGKVLFQKNDAKVVLVKDEEVDYNHKENNFSQKRAVDKNLMAWYTKEFNFDNIPIVEAIQSLERYIGKEIVLPQNSGKLRFTGAFSNPSEKDIAEVISLAMGWEYKITSSAITFNSKK